jgi:hypothetical protein
VGITNNKIQTTFKCSKTPNFLSKLIEFSLFPKYMVYHVTAKKIICYNLLVIDHLGRSHGVQATYHHWRKKSLRCSQHPTRRLKWKSVEMGLGATLTIGNV